MVDKMRGIPVECGVNSKHALVNLLTLTSLVVQVEEIGQPLSIILPENMKLVHR